MAQTFVRLVYSSVTKELLVTRRLADDSEHANYQPRPGEIYLDVPIAVANQWGDAGKAFLAQSVGAPTPAAPFMVVDPQGNVIDAVYRNPCYGPCAMITPDGNTLVQSSSMQVGGTYIKGVYAAPAVQQAQQAQLG